jgi:CRISPR/Cas system Type II protein with McrA/HNH and RuvC-like nuclease domain
VLESLAAKGHITIQDTDQDGTLYVVKLPQDIPDCRALIEAAKKREDSKDTAEDYYNIPGNRQKVYERDNFRCRYCGIEVTEKNATIDHIKPVSQRGDHSLANVVTACLKCNSIKSGRGPEESALDLLDRYKAQLKQPQLDKYS